MKKTLTLLTTLSILLVVSMISALPLSHSNPQEAVISIPHSKLTNAETATYANISHNASDSATSQALLNHESITATMLLLCTGLLGLVGISRKNN